MSRTFKIVNGQIDLDPSTGQVKMVEGRAKGGQDLAHSLLQDYLADNDVGSYLRQILQNPIPQAGDLFLRYYIAEAVQKLQSAQQKDPYITAGEQITAITELFLTDDGEGTSIFYLRVSTADGGEEAVAAETQLNHQYERF